jgi:hypothetical protein
MGRNVMAVKHRPIEKRAGVKKRRKSPGDMMMMVPLRNATAKRYRSAKSDGSIASLQRTIEKQLNLPSGSVKIVYPSGRKARSDADVGALRAHWKKNG